MKHRARTIIGTQNSEQIHHAGKSRESRAPTVAAIAGAELEAHPKRLARLAAVVEKSDHRLANNQRDITLEAVAQPLDTVSSQIAGRRKVNKYISAFNFYREGAHVVRPLIESAAAMQVEARVMPVAGQDGILPGAAIEREPHVRASVVDRENSLRGVKERDHLAVDAGGHARSLWQLGERSSAYEARLSLCHRARFWIHWPALRDATVCKVLALHTMSRSYLTNVSGRLG